MLYTWRFVFIFIFVTQLTKGNTVVQEFEDILKKEVYVAALLTKECCACTECVEAETLLAAMHQKLLADHGIVIVKLVEQPSIAQQYGVKDYPSIVFLRNQQPALYKGPYDMDSLLDWFSESKDVALKTLDDSSFEHLTQAATGATTGDWLVVFHNSSCGGDALHSVFDGLAIKVKNRVLVAQVDTEKSPDLQERFQIEKCPSVIMFRQSKMYRYPYSPYSLSSLQTFAEGLYKNVKADPVPLPKSPFEKLVEEAVFQLKANPMLFLMVVGGVLLFLATLYGISEKKAPKGRKQE